MPVKQVIVWRHDLNCRLGKKMGQAGHAALAHFEKLILDNMDAIGKVSFQLSDVQMEWYQTKARKIVLRVESEEELDVIYDKALSLGLPTTMIVDAGFTEWKVPTKTCISIGPETDEKFEEVTGEKGPLGKLKTL